MVEELQLLELQGDSHWLPMLCMLCYDSGDLEIHVTSSPWALKKGSNSRVNKHALYGKWLARCLGQ